jgi:hypothetical protein
MPGAPNAYLTGMSAHTTDPDGAFASFGIFGEPKIFATDDGGASWTNLTGTFTPGQPLSSNGFPDVVVYDVLSAPSNPDELWAATEVGLIVSSDAGATWGFPSFDLPRVAIWEMRIVDDEVVLATHGLGLWTVSVSVLPVELVAFEGVQSGDGVELTWATASETNNEGFTIERQTASDGDAWTAIGQLAGAGTTLEAQSYRFTDTDVPFEAQIVRYRLLQRDLDGGFEYSSTVEINLGAPQRFAVHPVFPNPIQSATTLRYELPRASDVQISVFDLSGRMVLRPVVQAEQAGRREARLDLSSLSNGTYFVRVEAGSDSDVQTVTVVR